MGAVLARRPREVIGRAADCRGAVIPIASMQPKIWGDIVQLRFMLTVLLGLAGAATEANAQADFKVTLLGTASPSPRPTRFGPSTLVEAGDQKLLFDAGRGVPIRMWQIKVPMGKLDALFIRESGRPTATALTI